MLFGLIATTKAGSAATAAVLAALTDALFVPSVTLVLWVPPVSVVSRAKPLVVPILAVTVPSTVREPPLSVTGIAVWLLAITTGEEAAIAA
jgi:hypothetical protein